MKYELFKRKDNNNISGSDSRVLGFYFTNQELRQNKTQPSGLGKTATWAEKKSLSKKF